MDRRGWLRRGAAFGMAVSAAASSRGDTWPSRPLRLVVPFPPGSSPDVVARLLAEPLGQALGVPVVVDNRPGAGGNLGTAAVARAAPDGQTWLLTIQGPLVTAPLLSRRLGYDPVRDLIPVTLVATSPNVLVADPALGAGTAAGFVRLARESGGRWNYGSVGTGSASHLAMAWFKARAGIDLVHIPYPGFPQVVNALLGGQVRAAFMVPGLAMPQVAAGRLQALGVTTLARSAVLPELPTLAEQGHAGFEAISWQAVLAPAGTPAPRVARVSEALVRIIRSDAFRTRLMAQYFSAAGTAPDALARLMASERERWGRVIRVAGVLPE
jgi:tripartite-type tricarboxylate transporter receptor subunit TctC